MHFFSRSLSDLRFKFEFLLDEIERRTTHRAEQNEDDAQYDADRCSLRLRTALMVAKETAPNRTRGGERRAQIRGRMRLYNTTFTTYDGTSGGLCLAPPGHMISIPDSFSYVR